MGQYEIKFAVGAAQVPAIRSWLRSSCQAERPGGGTVHSVYFDDPAWRLSAAKENSDLLKSKIRVRWYGDHRGAAVDGPSFIEAKFKDGAQRSKIRLPTMMSGREAARLPLHAPAWNRALRLLAEHGHPSALGLQAVFEVSYHRDRFVDPGTDTRFCFDHAIRAPRSNPLRCRPGRADQLPWAVFEQKGAGEHLLPRFHHLTDLGLRRGSFSKYHLARLHLHDD